MTAADELNTLLLRGVVPDVYDAERAYGLLMAIGRSADDVNARGYGELFGALQDALVRDLTLAVTRLYERPSKRYPTQSIPSVLAFLDAHARELEIREPWALAQQLRHIGIADIGGVSSEGEARTRALVARIRSVLPQTEYAAWCERSRALEALRTRRDKRIAHNERVAAHAIPSTTFAEAARLVKFAQGVVAAVGIGYAGTAYADDRGDYLLSFEAGVASRQAERLLGELKRAWASVA